MALPPPETCTVGSVTLAYREYGAGFPLVLINGLASAMDTWNPPVIETLSRHFRVIVFDNRGTGYSGASDEPFSVPLFARDTAGLMDALGIPCAHVLGFSMGACIAQELALAFPEKVDRLILVAGDCGGAEAVRTDPDVFSRLIDKSGTIEDVVNRMFPLLFPPAWLATHDPFRYCPGVEETTSTRERRPAARGIFVLARLVLFARKNPITDARDCPGTPMRWSRMRIRGCFPEKSRAPNLPSSRGRSRADVPSARTGSANGCSGSWSEPGPSLPLKRESKKVLSAGISGKGADPLLPGGDPPIFPCRHHRLFRDFCDCSVAFPAFDYPAECDKRGCVQPAREELDVESFS